MAWTSVRFPGCASFAQAVGGCLSFCGWAQGEKSLHVRVFPGVPHQQQVLAGFICGLSHMVFRMAGVRLLQRVHARGGRETLVSPSGRPPAVERGSRTEALTDALLLLIGLSCRRELGSQACIGPMGHSYCRCVVSKQNRHGGGPSNPPLEHRTRGFCACFPYGPVRASPGLASGLGAPANEAAGRRVGACRWRAHRGRRGGLVRHGQDVFLSDSSGRRDVRCRHNRQHGPRPCGAVKSSSYSGRLLGRNI